MGKTIVQNRRARFNYFIEETLEAGIVLLGSEIKSIRQGKINIDDAHAGEKDGSIYILNSHISEYTQANIFNHEPTRPRKLLLHKRQQDKLLGAIKRQGITLVALSLYFNSRGLVKVELGVAKGKKQHDKRASEKERDWNREKANLLKRG